MWLKIGVHVSVLFFNTAFYLKQRTTDTDSDKQQQKIIQLNDHQRK